MNASLVEIETEEEQDALVKVAMDKKYDSYNIYGFWIGLTDQAEEGTMVWESGGKVKFTAWSKWEPNNLFRSEDCVNLWVGWNRKGLWNDANCDTGDFKFGPKSWKYGGICEQSLGMICHLKHTEMQWGHVVQAGQKHHCTI